MKFCQALYCFKDLYKCPCFSKICVSFFLMEDLRSLLEFEDRNSELEFYICYHVRTVYRIGIQTKFCCAKKNPKYVAS